MLPAKLAFVDIETTGTRSSSDRIIEIGILRVEDNKLVKTYQTLINPQAYIPKEITMITGLRAEDLEDAPTFRAVKDDILEMLDDCVFVAHNVQFDYGFLKHEFIRENITFSTKHFCTVRLSRLLFPHWRRHNLDAVVENCQIACINRHRAFDDAKVLFDFYTKLQNDLPLETLEQALAKTMKKPSLPLHLPLEQLEKLPEGPGVYIFYGKSQSSEISSQSSEKETLILSSSRKSKTPQKNNKKDTENGQLTTEDKFPTVPLYVGKSINIRNRVLSHFAEDIYSPTEMKIAQQIEHIDTVTTTGELGALLLESQMIKELLPLYNKKSRIKHELIALSEIQILTWPFNGMIAIEEQEVSGKKDYFLINNWCYRGKITVDTEGNLRDDIESNAIFDLDVYRIIKQFLNNPAHKNKIKPIGGKEMPSASELLIHLR